MTEHIIQTKCPHCHASVEVTCMGHGWLPIASAPKDEVIIDLLRNRDRYTECWWNGERWVSYLYGDIRFEGDTLLYEIINPTHWMPLPNPPTEGVK